MESIVPLGIDPCGSW